MKRIAVIADTHLTSPSPDSQSLFPRQMAKLSSNKANVLYSDLRYGIGDANNFVLQRLLDTPSDILIHLGDVTGGWQEVGIHEHSLLELARHNITNWKLTTSDLRFCVGRHDTGYSHRGSLPHGGLNIRSVELCREVFGDLWWLKEIEGITLLGICSPVAEYNKSNERLSKLQSQQEEFLLNANNRIDGKPWILFAHDPFLPKIVSHQLQHQIPNCKAFIHGRLHNPAYTKWLRKLGWLFGRPLLRKSHTCPSVAPLWYHGGGMMELTIDGTMVTIENRFVDLPPSATNVPTASFFRCLRWMLWPH